MSLQVKQETNYAAAFREIVETANESAWLKILRENAIDGFRQLGFPTVDKEDWKYTNVAPFVKNEFEIASASENASDEKLTAFSIAEASRSVLTFVNGKISEKLTDLSAIGNGSVVLSLAEALRDERFAETVKMHFARGVDYDANGFTALNTAFWRDGAFVFVPKNTKVEAPIHLQFVSNGEQTASFPRVLIVLERGAEAVLVESYVRADETAYLTDSIVEIVLADEARLKHYRVQRESHRALHVLTTHADLGRGSFYDATNLNFGAALSRHEIGVRFNAEGAECFVDGLYMVGDVQHTDTHSIIEHTVKNCTSHQTYKGVLSGKSRAVFNGKVFVAEGASGTDGYQSNKNLLLSNDARVDTKPQLEIFNDDVKCSHGATVGQIEDEELFYLLSRGLNETLARNLLTYGFAEELISKIEIESIKKQLDEAVLNRLETKLD
jgi:Fe-S cluster assembly protein SufD